MAAELYDIHSSRLWRLRNTIKSETRIIGKVKQITKLCISLCMPTPLRHTLTLGLQRLSNHSMVVKPSTRLIDFDEAYYLELYPDIAEAGVDPYTHYQQHGKSEGRLSRMPDIPGIENISDHNPARETVLVILHEASRTGAPILGYNLAHALLEEYNVITICIGPGPIIETLQLAGSITIGPIPYSNHVIGHVITEINNRITIKFAIVNSIVSSLSLKPLALQFIPTVILIHEFASYTLPHGIISDAVLWAGSTIFSSSLIKSDACEHCPDLNELDLLVIPQGRSRLPPETLSAHLVEERLDDYITELRPSSFPSDGIVVLGLGSVQFRKGVDLFLSCAALVKRRAPELPIRFAWIGKGYDPLKDAEYSVYLAAQIKRAALDEMVIFIREQVDLTGIYNGGDIMLITSRLDPLPNVAIDALSEGLPVLCFDNATGIADILRMKDLDVCCVSPYLDISDMADKVIILARSEKLRKSIALRSKQLAKEIFVMPQYVSQIEEVAIKQIAKTSQERKDVSTIIQSGLFNIDFARDWIGNACKEDEAVAKFVRGWASGVLLLKPCPGFHPGIYKKYHELGQPVGDPFANYLRTGKSVGPWITNVLNTSANAGGEVVGVRVALHVVVQDADLVMPLMEPISQSITQIDLFFYVMTDLDKDRIVSICKDYNFVIKGIQIVSSLETCSIAVLQTLFSSVTFLNYDIIGKIHATNKPAISDIQITRNMPTHSFVSRLGVAALMTDMIIKSMANNLNLGIIYSDDPKIYLWGTALKHAKDMASNFRISSYQIDPYLPLGRPEMYWIRTSLLQSISETLWPQRYCSDEMKDVSNMDYFILEQLLPLITSILGYENMTAYMPAAKL